MSAQPDDAAEAGRQDEVFGFLSDPQTHGIGTPVQRIDTHGAAVFLAGDDAYKVKRAVRYPFLDFSTLEKRKAACETEIAVNRGNAPDIYIGAVAIVRDGGSLRIGGRGEIVEWAVHMRRFDESRTLDRIADRGEPMLELIPALTDAVLASHRRAPERRGEGPVAALLRHAADTVRDLEQTNDVLKEVGAGDVTRDLAARLNGIEQLMQRRSRDGHVRHCHGDLHLRNIVMIGERPVLFDALEFDETMAVCDVLYDLAFLLMDFWHRGLRAEANLIANRYLWGCADEAAEIEGLAALPAFMALRAAIRAKVAIEAARLGGDGAAKAAVEAGRYLDTARECLSERPARLVAIGGRSGTGKSTLAAKLSSGLGRPPGAVHLRSDIERKRLFKANEFDRLPDEAYKPEATRLVYGRLAELSEIALRAGQSVLADAVHLRESERARIEAVAAGAGAEFTGLWLEAPKDVLTQRVRNRRNDASDATAEVVAAQAAQDAGTVGWRRLDSSKDMGRLAAEAKGLIGG